MWVPPHPHTGLQTVTWLFEGLGLHTDSLGSRQLIRPGQLNVMTAGARHLPRRGVARRTRPTLLHGVQLWVCLPDDVRDSAPAGLHAPRRPADRTTERGVTVRVLVGSLGGRDVARSDVHPARRRRADPRARRARRPAAGPVVRVRRPRRAGRRRASTASGIERNAMSYLGDGRRELALRGADRGRGATRSLMLLGGEPFEEEIVMWWNFIGRSHEEIVEQREAWNGDGLDAPAGAVRHGRGLRRRPAAGPADAEHPAQGRGAAPPDRRRGRSTGLVGKIDANVAHVPLVRHNGGTHNCTPVREASRTSRSSGDRWGRRISRRI